MSILPQPYRGCAVYQILNTVNGNCYVGSTVNYDVRTKSHRNLLKKGKHHSVRLQNAWNAHGEDAFVFVVLEQVASPSEVVAREQHFIDSLQPAYNMAPTAGTTLGRKHSEATKAKISASRVGQVLPPEVIAKIAAKKRGQKHTDEQRQRISDGLRSSDKVKEAAKTRVFLGRRPEWTPEKRREQSQILKGRAIPEERRLRIVATLSARGPRNPAATAKMLETRAKMYASGYKAPPMPEKTRLALQRYHEKKRQQKAEAKEATAGQLDLF